MGVNIPPRNRDEWRVVGKWALISGVIFVLFVGGSIIVGGVGDQRATSQYTGEVVDLENERGVLLRTTQVHLKTDAQASSSETFCVIDENRDEQLPVLRDAARNGHTVTVTYERPLYVPLWECEKDTSIIRDVEIRQEGGA